MASQSDPKWCCVSSLTKIVTFFAVPFWSIPTPPAGLHQLSFFDRCENFVPFVGQAISFCGLIDENRDLLCRALLEHTNSSRWITSAQFLRPLRKFRALRGTGHRLLWPVLPWHKRGSPTDDKNRSSVPL